MNSVEKHFDIDGKIIPLMCPENYSNMLMLWNLESNHVDHLWLHQSDTIHLVANTLCEAICFSSNMDFLLFGIDKEDDWGRMAGYSRTEFLIEREAKEYSKDIEA